jgi:hypothetical protein
MGKQGWESFTFSELLAPPWGWKADAAILTTFSADLVAIVHSLLALSGFDFDQSRRPSRLGLIRATEALSGRVRVLAQRGRIAIPKSPPEILRLMDRFILEVPTDEQKSSFHPKISLIRYQEIDRAESFFWRLWLGSKNLTRSFNWEAGIVLEGRTNSDGQRISSLLPIAADLARRAKLSCLSAKKVENEMHSLTWQAPEGCHVNEIRFMQPGQPGGYPQVANDAKRLIVVSPFLDEPFLQKMAVSGGDKTTRCILSTDSALQAIAQEAPQLLKCFGENIFVQAPPDYSIEADSETEVAEQPSQTTEDEEAEPGGLHAKLILAEEHKKWKIWIGSANATSRAWEGRNYEIVAELSTAVSTCEGLLKFIALCPRFTPSAAPQQNDEVQEHLERVRSTLNLNWGPKQVFQDGVHLVVANTAPPIPPEIKLEIAFLGGNWGTWPHGALQVGLPSSMDSLRSEFLQFRITSKYESLAWVRLIPCDPQIDELRDKRLIGRYLDTKTFFLWLRSLLSEASPGDFGGDWDGERPHSSPKSKTSHISEMPELPTLEDVLRSWAHDPASFVNANQRFSQYITELEQRADAERNDRDKSVLTQFRDFWDLIAKGLI